MLLDVLRFNRQSLELLQGNDNELELGQYLERNRYSREFIEHYLIPMGAAIWSAPPERFRQFPARFIVNFFNNHGLLTVRGHPRWKTVQGGAARYVQAITRPFADRIRLNCRVVAVRRNKENVSVAWDRGGTEDFDAVVLAAHSDESLAMLSDASEAERDILGAIAYQRNETAIFAYRCAATAAAAASLGLVELSDSRRRATGGADPGLNRLRNRLPDPICVTLNGITESTRRRFCGISTTIRSIVARRLAAQAISGEINGKDRTYFCGATGGLVSRGWGQQRALAVGQCFGKRLESCADCLYQGYVQQHRRLVTRRFPLSRSIWRTWTSKNCRRCWRSGYGLSRAQLPPPRSTATTISAIRQYHAGRRCQKPGRGACRVARGKSAADAAAELGLLLLPSACTTASSPAETVEAVVAEVTNTPWHDGIEYVLDAGNRERTTAASFSPSQGLSCRHSWTWICSTGGVSVRPGPN